MIMKKILFNDKFGLTQAVLDGRKTMTRRIVPQRMIDAYEDWLDEAMTIALPSGTRFMPIADYLLKRTSYKVGEVVAVAQSYKTITDEFRAHQCIQLAKHPGWKNKMFVKADLMPHHIRITNVKIERLQDISDEECLREGVEFSKERYEYDGTKSYFVQGITRIGSRWNRMFCKHFDTPREAFAALIDKVSGKGAWESNPWVFAYEFELVD